MAVLQQNIATNIMIFMVGSSDHLTGKTGLTLTITASKNGGAFAAITPVVVERGNGWYSLALTTAHTNTLGDLALHITGTAADPRDIVYRIEEEPALSARVIWEYARRTLTYSPVNLMSIQNTGLSLIRGDIYTYVFEDITDLATYNINTDIIYFTIKRNYKDEDCDAIVQIDTDTGITILNGQKVATAQQSTASLAPSVVNETVTLVIEASITKQFPYSDDGFFYDLEIIRTGDDPDTIITPYLGTLNIIRDVTRKVA